MKLATTKLTTASCLLGRLSAVSDMINFFFFFYEIRWIRIYVSLNTYKKDIKIYIRFFFKRERI